MNKILIVGVIIVLSFFGSFFIKKSIYKNLYYALQQKDFQNLYKIIDSFLTKMFIPVKTRENLRLIAYIRQDQPEKVTNQMNQLFKYRLLPQQKKEVLIQGFNYFAYKKDHSKIKRILKEMKEILEKDEYLVYQRHDDIVFNHSVKYTDRLQQDLLNQKGRRRSYIQYLLYCSYRNANNMKQAEIYLNESLNGYKVNMHDLEKMIQVIK